MPVRYISPQEACRERQEVHRSQMPGGSEAAPKPRDEPGIAHSPGRPEAGSSGTSSPPSTGLGPPAPGEMQPSPAARRGRRARRRARSRRCVGAGSSRHRAVTTSSMPSAAPCHHVGLAPRSTRRRAASQSACATASESAAPPVKTAPPASMSGTEVQQRIDRHDVIVAGGPVQRGLDATGILGHGAQRPGVDVCACRGQRLEGRRDVGKTPRPIGRHVDQRALQAIRHRRFRTFARPGSSASMVG